MAIRQYTQANRKLGITTPLGDDVLLLRGFVGEEYISRPFHFHLELLSHNESISYPDIVGKNVTLHIELADQSLRYWNGHISRFSQGSRDEVFVSYHAEFVPWLWFLSRTADCRIFQQKKVPDIIDQIFSDLGFKDFEFRLYSEYVERDFCVQYREQDLEFISRLAEEEGIFYFFEHKDGKHTLVLSDDPAAHKPCPNQSKARCQLTEGGTHEDDVVLSWRQEQQVRPGKYALDDYNFETPSTDLKVEVKGKSEYEIYDYPGEYLKRDEGDSLVLVRLQEEEMPRLVAQGKSTCRSFVTGYRFDLEEHYRADLNQSYVLTGVRHEATQGGDYSGAQQWEGAEFNYSNEFECIPYSTPYRPPRITTRPVVEGCQTAVVVGPSGEEIYTDRHGRVKVQFHWDREGKKDENSSCWIRVSHPWAGKGWGSLQIPRIGQEVIVDFLEGDPDQPIITGRVYNAEQTPPFGLPGGAVISGVKSNSTKGGGGYNQISLDDTKGNELIHVHAQYDQDIKVEHDERTNVGNDRTESVGHDETISIGNNRTETVGVDESITIGNNRTESVGVNEKIDIGSNRTETVGANEMITVALTRTRNVGVNEVVNVGAAQEITIGGLQALTVGITRAKNIGTSETVGIGTNQTINVGANRSLTVGSNDTVKVGSDRSTNVGENDTLQVGKNLAVTAGDQISLTTGKASIVMKKDGTITIKGKDITIQGSGQITVKATNNIVMKGKKILQN